ncbi:MAG: RNA polymerase sigma-70 factor [Marinilabiliales bacterium]|nr:MAG: RNA polymerase sigma-70 factor [Marinilabiliales bacterium]
MIDERILIEGINKGDKLIFEEVYREYYIPLCYYCLRYVETLEDSEEIVQDLFVKIWEKRTELEINTSIKAYLYRSVQNYALNYLNKKKTEDRYLMIHSRQIHDEFDIDRNELVEEELRLLLKHAILKLPEKRRRIFELSRFDGMKYSRIAEKLSISVKTVESQMTKALKYLRIVLKDYTPIIGFILFISNKF